MHPPPPPWSSDTLRDPYPFYAALRESGPVRPLAAFGGAWAVTRHDDIVPALKAPLLFSSQRVAPALHLPPELEAQARRYFTARSNLLSADPPVHTRLRTLVSKAFTPRRIADLEPRIRALTRELLAPLRAHAEVELMAALAVPLPVIVISELLGVEPERREDFKRWSDHVLRIVALSQGRLEPGPILHSLAQMHAYLEDIIARRRRSPREDLISALVESGEGVLEPEELLSFIRLLLVAGNETTTNLIGNALVSLVRHPAELARLQADPTLTASALEETLRYEGPVQALMRMATEDTRIAGQPIAAGERVFLLLAAANRDPRRYVDPDRFDITRDSPGHLAFGHGIHFCLGAPLARLEARVALEELLPRVRALSFAPGQEQSLSWGESLLLRGPQALRLRVEWRSEA